MVAPNLTGPRPMAEPAELVRALETDPVARSRPRVYLMRGLAQTVSEGVDHLSVKLHALGYRASVHAYGEWREIANRIIADRAASQGRSRAVVVGHSLGANSVVELVNALAERGVEADLAVTFDPTVDLTVQGGVVRFLNFYQSDNGWGRAVAIGPRAQGRVSNIDLKHMDHLTHFTIDRDATVHQRVISAIQAIPQRGAQQQPVEAGRPVAPGDRS